MRAPVVAVLNERRVCLPRPGNLKGGPDVRFSTFKPGDPFKISWPILILLIALKSMIKLPHRKEEETSHSHIRRGDNRRETKRTLSD